MQSHFKSQLIAALKTSPIKFKSAPPKPCRVIDYEQELFSDGVIDDGYNQQRMGYEFKDYCIPEFVVAGPWAKHRVKIVQGCAPTWARVNSLGDKVYKKRACTFGDSAAHSRESSNYAGVEISNLYASKLRIQDYFKELAKTSPNAKAAALDKKYKASLTRCTFIWAPKQKV